MILTVKDGDSVTKDPVDSKVLHFDWDAENFAPGVIFAVTPTITATAVSGDTTTTPLVIDQVAALTGTRKAQFRWTAGAAGSTWRVSCTVLTTETPAQTIKRSISVTVVER